MQLLFAWYQITMSGVAIFIIIFGVFLIGSMAYAVFGSSSDKGQTRRKVHPQRKKH